MLKETENEETRLFCQTFVIGGVSIVRARRRWAQVQFLSNQFWCRWVNEFMSNLTQRQKRFQPERNVQVGDVVLLAESMQQRSKWVMGRVIETYPDKHGKVRTVLLKTSGSTMKRPSAKLCVILSESAC